MYPHTLFLQVWSQILMSVSTNQWEIKYKNFMQISGEALDSRPYQEV